MLEAWKTSRIDVGVEKSLRRVFTAVRCDVVTATRRFRSYLSIG
jgi:hypothetical protein